MDIFLSKTIRHYRKLAGISQEVLAQKAGLTKDHIGLIERGKLTNPTLKTAFYLAKALGIKVQDLVNEKAA